MRTLELIFGVLGQSFHYDAPEGRPDASPTPTLTVVLNMSSDNIATLEAATTGAVAIDAVNTTLAQAAAVGTVAITLASGSSIAKGRRYLVTSSTTGDQEWIEVVAFVGTAVVARRPLLNAYPAGSTFVGARMTAAVSATWIADQGKISDVFAADRITARLNTQEWLAGYAGYRARWSYSFGGSPTIGVSYADVVRYQAKNLVTPLDVDTEFPGWIDRLPPDYREDQGASLIATAFKAVRYDAMGDNEVLRRIRNTEILGELTVFKANVKALEANVLDGRGDPAALQVARDLYAQRYDQLMREPKFQSDSTGDGSAGPAERLPVFRR